MFCGQACNPQKREGDSNDSSDDSFDHRGSSAKQTFFKKPPPIPPGSLILTPSSSEKVSSENLRKPNPQPTSASRRSLFPTKKHTKSTGNLSRKHSPSVSFYPSARVTFIPTYPESLHEKIWWQKSDYDGFKRTSVVLGKALSLGGDLGEVWMTKGGGLTLNPIYVCDDGNESGFRGKVIHGTKMREPPLNIGSSIVSGHVDEEGNRKWWCEYGHSRRGLEHISDGPEKGKGGQRRQNEVNRSIKAVLDEQDRQRRQSTPSGTPDSNSASSSPIPFDNLSSPPLQPQPNFNPLPVVLTNGMIDSSWRRIAQASERRTKWAREMAFLAGREDEETVKNLWHGDDEVVDDIAMQPSLASTEDSGEDHWEDGSSESTSPTNQPINQLTKHRQTSENYHQKRKEMKIVMKGNMEIARGLR